jgi:lysophospholipase L1-like esterase
MPTADKTQYLKPLCGELCKLWPDNRTVNIVCHGHSVPSGYFRTPYVDTFNAYPHLFHRLLRERFPFSVTNVIVTGIGGENSERGAARFKSDVLCHRPGALTIDYSLNDRAIGLERSKKAWSEMIEAALEKDVKVILLTPTMDDSAPGSPAWTSLKEHSEQVKTLASQYAVGLADSFGRWEREIANGRHLQELLSQSNHPSAAGHRLVAEELVSWLL